MKQSIIMIIILIVFMTSLVNAGEVYLFSGKIYENNSVQLNPALILGLVDDYPEDYTENSEYSIAFYGSELKIFNFELSGEEGNRFSFSVDVPFQTQRIVFRQFDNEIHEVTISPNAPIINNFIVQNNGDDISASWQASDADGDQIKYNLYYQLKSQWIPYSLYQTQNSAAINSWIISGGETMLKLEASDGFNKAEIISSPFTIENKPPIVFIFSPATDSGFTYGTNINLYGGVYDPDTDNLNNFSWISDIDGYLGDTEYLSTNLSKGTHKITFTSSNGQFSSNDSVEIIITDKTSPDLSIKSLEIPSTLEPNQNATVKATIQNIITDAVFTYALYDGNPSEAGILIKEDYAFAQANSILEINIPWTDITTGKHDLYFSVYNATPEEYTLENNEKSVSINYGIIYEDCNGADINRDGEVSIGDFGILGGNWGKKNCTYLNNFCNGADINRDGEVSIGDFGILGGNWGKKNCLVPDLCLGADINQDGNVDGSDLSLLLTSYGREDCSEADWCDVDVGDCSGNYDCGVWNADGPSCEAVPSQCAWSGGICSQGWVGDCSVLPEGTCQSYGFTWAEVYNNVWECEAPKGIIDCSAYNNNPTICQGLESYYICSWAASSCATIGTTDCVTDATDETTCTALGGSGCGAWNAATCTGINWCSGADINQDGNVDGSDLSLFLTSYGREDCLG